MNTPQSYDCVIEPAGGAGTTINLNFRGLRFECLISIRRMNADAAKTLFHTESPRELQMVAGLLYAYLTMSDGLISAVDSPNILTVKIYTTKGKMVEVVQHTRDFLEKRLGLTADVLLGAAPTVRAVS